jgi:hypothetical protein
MKYSVEMGSVAKIYIPSSIKILSGTGFPFRRLLRLAGLTWSCSNPPPRGLLQYYKSLDFYWQSSKSCLSEPLCTDNTENAVPILLYHFAFVSVAAGRSLPSRCLETALVYLLMSRSLRSNGSARFIVLSLEFSPPGRRHEFINKTEKTKLLLKFFFQIHFETDLVL